MHQNIFFYYLSFLFLHPLVANELTYTEDNKL